MSGQSDIIPNALSTNAELYEFRLAAERLAIVEEYKANLVDKKTAMLRMGVQHAQFHRICKRVEEKGGMKGAARLLRGRKKGAVISVKFENIISEKFEGFFKGPSASMAEVWRQVQAVADQERIPCPSYHTIRRWIQENVKQREIVKKQYGAEAADQIFGAKPGFYLTKRPLEWVQIDHTLVDVLIVDDDDPTTIIGRPWASFAIDVHTRAVIGFHLSLLAPSSITVALLIANAVLPKKKILEALGVRSDLLPMHGLMDAIHTDNAKEFVTELLETKCNFYGIKLHHRDLGQKHQGGHIERLIGTMMTTRVHFYRGATFSNSQQRKGQSSEKLSCLTFKDLRELMIFSINTYHGTIHSSLKNKSPLVVWNEYHEKFGPPKELEQHLVDDFRISFYPEKIKLNQPAGINILGRRYWGCQLSNHVRSRVLVKYDPYDTSSILVLMDGKYLKIPCSRNEQSRDDDYEMYRYQKTKKGTRPGTITSELSRRSVLEVNDIQDKAEKRKRLAKSNKRKEAIKQHKGYKDALMPPESDLSPITVLPLPALRLKVDKTHVSAMSSVDFEQDVVIFEVD
ncbi:MAG: transposase family protein [Pseudomonas sp.]|uniref:Mu transposase C-terminal domain-containing protein n=1 Tax=Pseudomonas sp. TaxID=306 RepID=UPI003BB6E069